MTPKKDAYMRGYHDGFKDAAPELEAYKKRAISAEAAFDALLNAEREPESLASPPPVAAHPDQTSPMTVGREAFEEEPKCARCNDTGWVAIRSSNGAYAFPGRVPEETKGYAEFPCRNCSTAYSAPVEKNWRPP